jgi:demethylmenaquinone methyltransferase/2-methoxy-6-polyprenyl-1,4-benzoquinol methylase
MSLAQRDLFIRQIFTTVAPYYSLGSGFSFGLDRHWRKRAIARSGIREGDRVLDVCTGTGSFATLIAQQVGPTGSVTGADFCAEMLNVARKKYGSRRANLSFILSDAKRLPFGDNTFDAVTVAFGMRNIPDTALALQELKRVLKPGGIFLCLELTRPHVRWFRLIYEWYVFRIMPFIAKLVLKTAAPYLYLPRSINSFYPPDEFKSLINRCGYAGVTADSLTMGIATIYKAVNPVQEQACP